MTEREALIALNMVNGIGSIKLNNLIGRFKIASGVFNSGEKELLAVDGIGKEIAGGILNFKRVSLEKEMRRAGEMGIEIITLYDDKYPGILKTIYDPPPVLYTAGDIFNEEIFTVGMVGTRDLTEYGVSAVHKLIHEMAFSGIRFGVISGMARGIDTEAHKAALRYGVYTAAVLGFGLGRIFPFEKNHTARKIKEQGALISEFPLEMQGSKQSFPRRNRIISGLSNGVIVIEAGEKSGTLITADCALEQGREVFAVPGSILKPKSKGANRLIAQGAKLIQDINDVIEEFEGGRGFIRNKTQKQQPEKPAEIEIDISGLSQEEKKIVHVLKKGEKHIDIIALETEIDIIKLSSVLTLMELKGVISQLKGKKFGIFPGAAGAA